MAPLTRGRFALDEGSLDVPLLRGTLRLLKRSRREGVSALFASGGAGLSLSA